MNKQLFKIGAFLIITSAGMGLASYTSVKVAEEINYQAIRLKNHIRHRKEKNIDDELEKLRKELKKKN